MMYDQALQTFNKTVCHFFVTKKLREKKTGPGRDPTPTRRAETGQEDEPRTLPAYKEVVCHKVKIK